MSRRLRLAVGIVPTVALFLAAALAERFMHGAGRLAFSLRDWMDPLE